MAVYKFRGRRIQKFKQGQKVRVKQDSPSPYHGLAGTVKIITSEESGLVYSITFDSSGKLAAYATINEADLEVMA